MSHEPEAIRQEMDETRNSLTDKISILEQQVVDTVHEASAGVKETVEAVKDAVQETVQTVKSTVGSTVDSVKETFSVSRQVENHPWMMMAGSVGAGFLAGYVLNAPSTAAAPSKSAPVLSSRRPGNGSHREPAFEAASSAAPSDSGANGLAQLTQIFESEINQLKGLAIGTLAGIVRDMVVANVPEMMRNPLNEVFNDFTVKFGGHAIPGKFFSSDCDAKVSQQQPSYAHPRQSAPFPG